MAPPAPLLPAPLRALARFAGVQTSFVYAGGQRRQASREAVEALLEVLCGEPPSDPAVLLRRLRSERNSRLLEPVTVAWLPRRGRVTLTLPRGYSGPIQFNLRQEDGAQQGWKAELEAVQPGDDGFVRAEAQLPHLPAGYHRLDLRAGARRGASTLVVAPSRAFSRPRRGWGVFMPLYALQSQRSWGAGDLGDLAELARWVEGLGGESVATLPLLAQFLQDDIFEPSPYSPASRLMWNELYADLEALPEVDEQDEVRDLIARLRASPEAEKLRRERLVDYAALDRLKQRALTAAAGALSPGRIRALRSFLAGRPEVESYARFRAVTGRKGPWQAWDEATQLEAQKGEVLADPAARMHAYAQQAMDRQMEAVDDGRGRLYLDLPLGVHSAGYDTWRWPGAFMTGASAGAPPDLFFSGGQDWGFPPPHPDGDREHGYEYTIAYLRHHLRFAGRLRVDHVMGLHRLYCIPRGFPATDGAYVRYRSDEVYAILCLESHRHRSEIVGENLGTVPGYVNRAMRRHALSGMYVLPFELQPDADPAVRPPPPGYVASLNTHDLPPFAAWWSGDDIERRRGGQMEGDAERLERKEAQDAAVRYLRRQGLLESGQRGPEAVMRALLRFMGLSEASLVLVNLEDLWGETQPQNLPGTTTEHPNWRRKARFDWEHIRQMPEVVEALKSLDAARRAGGGEGG